MQLLFTVQFDFLHKLTDSQQIRLARAFALLHNLGNIYEYSKVRVQKSSHLNVRLLQMYFGHYPLLEKGPLVKILGGEKLLEDSLQSTKHTKSMVLGVLCLSCAVCHIVVSLLRKLNYRLLDRYAPEFNRLQTDISAS